MLLQSAGNRGESGSRGIGLKDLITGRREINMAQLRELARNRNENERHHHAPTSFRRAQSSTPHYRQEGEDPRPACEKSV